jgi:hypothetical protein
MRMRRKRVPREPTPSQNPSTPPDKFRVKSQFHENEEKEFQYTMITFLLRRKTIFSVLKVIR